MANGDELTPDDRVVELEAKVGELESRIAEAGRRALFHVESNPGREPDVKAALAEIGRALLFDTETPPVEHADAA